MQVLSSGSQKFLLQLCRESIKRFLGSGDLPETHPDDPLLTQKAGCFITLRIQGSLRGCVGTFLTEAPLYENAIRMARAAAFQDIRFEPLTKDELEKIRIECSVLGELKRVGGIESIETGRHGIYIKHGDRSGTLLPEVATEQGWSREEFVMYCARQKAGLSPEQCTKAEIYRYEVQKFSERQAE